MIQDKICLLNNIIINEEYFDIVYSRMKEINLRIKKE